MLCQLAELPNESTAQAFVEAIGTTGKDVLDGLLASEDSRNAAIASLEEFPNYRIRIEDQLGPIQNNKYCAINCAGAARPVRVGLIGNEPIGNLPTELENLVFWAIISPNTQWQTTGQNTNGESVIGWRSLATGKAIIAEPIDASFGGAGQAMLSAMMGTSHHLSNLHAAPSPLLSTASIVNCARALADFSQVQACLLSEASTTLHPKWRFLSFYRILENAYLSNIRQALLSDFEKNAKEAVESAKKKLASEPNQLVALADSADLSTGFQAFNTAFDALFAANNKYIVAVDRSAENEPLYGSPDAYKKGIQRFYKIRCSIAHAGTSDVIYEQFTDANSAILGLLPTVEEIALKSLKITAIAT